MTSSGSDKVADGRVAGDSRDESLTQEKPSWTSVPIDNATPSSPTSVEGAAGAIAFYEKAFGAQQLFRVAGNDGKVVDGEIAICGSVVMIGDPGDGGLYGEPRKLGGCTAGLHMMVDDNEALLRALKSVNIRPHRVLLRGWPGQRSLGLSSPPSARGRVRAR